MARLDTPQTVYSCAECATCSSSSLSTDYLYSMLQLQDHIHLDHIGLPVYACHVCSQEFGMFATCILHVSNAHEATNINDINKLVLPADSPQRLQRLASILDRSVHGFMHGAMSRYQTNQLHVASLDPFDREELIGDVMCLNAVQFADRARALAGVGVETGVQTDAVAVTPASHLSPSAAVAAPAFSAAQDADATTLADPAAVDDDAASDVVEAGAYFDMVSNADNSAFGFDDFGEEIGTAMDVMVLDERSLDAPAQPIRPDIQMGEEEDEMVDDETMQEVVEEEMVEQMRPEQQAMENGQQLIVMKERVMEEPATAPMRELGQMPELDAVPGELAAPRLPMADLAVHPARSPFVPQLGDSVVYINPAHHEYLSRADAHVDALPLGDLSDGVVTGVLVVRCGERECTRPLYNVTLAVSKEGGEEVRTFDLAFHAIPGADFLVLRSLHHSSIHNRLSLGDPVEKLCGDGMWLSGYVEGITPNTRNGWRSLRVEWCDEDRTSQLVSPWDIQKCEDDRVDGSEAEVLAWETVWDEDGGWTGGRDAVNNRLIPAIHKLSTLTSIQALASHARDDGGCCLDVGIIFQRIQNGYYRRCASLCADVCQLVKDRMRLALPRHTLITAHALQYTLEQIVKGVIEVDVKHLYQSVAETLKERREDVEEGGFVVVSGDPAADHAYRNSSSENRRPDDYVDPREFPAIPDLEQMYAECFDGRPPHGMDDYALLSLQPWQGQSTSNQPNRTKTRADAPKVPRMYIRRSLTRGLIATTTPRGGRDGGGGQTAQSSRHQSTTHHRTPLLTEPNHPAVPQKNLTDQHQVMVHKLRKATRKLKPEVLSPSKQHPNVSIQSPHSPVAKKFSLHKTTPVLHRQKQPAASKPSAVDTKPLVQPTSSTTLHQFRGNQANGTGGDRLDVSLNGTIDDPIMLE